MYGMFSGCSGLTTLDLTHFDTSKVTDMTLMFFDCSNLPSLDLTHFNTSSVTDMRMMFGMCSGLTTLDLIHFDTSNLVDMTEMFVRCTSLTTLDLSNFDTSNVMVMHGLFNFCKNLTTVNLSNFNTSKVTGMIAMFSDCDQLSSLDLSSFDMSNVTMKYHMFSDCNQLSSLTLGEKTRIDDTRLSEIDTSSGVYTGRWVKTPDKSNVFESSSKFMENYNGSSSGTYVWETNKQSIKATDYTMHIGDKAPTVTDFEALATDKEGNEIEVSVDLSSADLTKVGTYKVPLTSVDGQKVEVTLTVLKNKQSIKGSDYTMYVGDKVPTVSNFGASATDKEGNEIEVSADLSAVDLTKAGTYKVPLTSVDGQKVEVTLTVLENKQSIKGTDYTMYIGDKVPTVTDFKASATDKEGNVSEVTVDLSAADLTKAGTYNVQLKSEDGQITEVKLTVLAKDPIKLTQNSSNPIAAQNVQTTNRGNTIPITGETTPNRSNTLPVTGEANTRLSALVGLSVLSIGSFVKIRTRKTR